MSKNTDINTSDTLLSIEQALQYIQDTVASIDDSESCALEDAYQRIVAEDVISPVNVPAFANSAMDGYAINSVDLPSEGIQQLTVINEAFAGHPYKGKLQPGQAIRIMTGAAIPEGADTVIMQEQVERDGDIIHIQSGHRPGENVRHLGEDIKMGNVVLSTGKRIGAVELGLLASLGIPSLQVKRRLRVATFSTGDELCAPGETPAEGQIYDSNRYSLKGMLRALDLEHIDLGLVRDDPVAIEQAFASATNKADVLITSGGVSVGDADYVTAVLNKLGKVDFWKIKMKPGKPLAFGKLGKTIFFGLPGNPVSAVATFYLIVQPSLRKLAGENTTQTIRVKARCMDDLKSPARTDFQRGIVEQDANGELIVRSTGQQGSHILSSMSQANCFIVLAEDCRKVSKGEMVEIEFFRGLMPA